MSPGDKKTTTQNEGITVTTYEPGLYVFWSRPLTQTR
jgi:hypothetical protein